MLLAFSSVSHARSVKQIFRDNGIAIALRAKFGKDKVVPSHKISIGVRDNIVTLRGELESQAQIDRAIEIAEQQKHVQEVQAYLVLEEYGELADNEKPKKSFLKSLFGGKDRKSSKKAEKSTEVKEKDLIPEKIDIDDNEKAQTELNRESLSAEFDDTGKETVTEKVAVSDNRENTAPTYEELLDDDTNY
jgi:hypothetical protein